MFPSTRRGESDAPMTQPGHDPSGADRFRDETPQPEMWAPARTAQQESQEPTYWLVPDTRDDIVVSRISDF